MKELRNIPGFNTIVVALTANAINGMKEKYLNDGFDDYLAKPIDKNELYTILKRYLCFDDNNVEMETININKRKKQSLLLNHLFLLQMFQLLILVIIL